MASFNFVSIENIRNVRKYIVECENKYFYTCRVDLTFSNNEKEIDVLYTAVQNDKEPTGRWVFNEIENGQYIGELQSCIVNVNQIIAKDGSVIEQKSGFVTTTISVDDWNIYRSFAEYAGAISYAHDIADNKFRISIMTAGSRKLESIDGSEPPIIFNVGDFNNDPHDTRSADKKYKCTALEPNTEMYCVWRKDKKPFDYTRFNLQPNETLELPKFKRAFFGGGKTLFGTGPHIIRADFQDRSINIIESAFGIVF